MLIARGCALTRASVTASGGQAEHRRLSPIWGYRPSPLGLLPQPPPGTACALIVLDKCTNCAYNNYELTIFGLLPRGF